MKQENMPIDLIIRPFAAGDYEAQVTIWNLIFPDYPVTVEELSYEDEHRDPKCKFQRWVAERDGQVLGSGEYDQSAWMYHPHKFWINIKVHPQHEGQGIGSALYRQVAQALHAHDPLALWAEIREDQQRGQHFLEQHGFKEGWRRWESRLNLATFDPAPYAGLEQRLAAEGITLHALSKLEDDPQLDQRIYELDTDVSIDVPSAEPRTPINFEQFMQWFKQHPDFLPDANFIAVHQGQYIGLSNLWRNQSTNDLTIGMTGVRRAYRGRGIATALKLRGIAYAKAHGHDQLLTWNDSINETMLAINVKMGFVRQPAWIHLIKLIKEEEHGTTTH